MSEKVVLRDITNSFGRRRLSAYLTAKGNLVIEGWDFGDGVEQVFGPGVREYEWAWTVKLADIPALLEALGATGQVLVALKARFSGEAGAGLEEFLKDQGIQYEAWSRLGD